MRKLVSKFKRGGKWYLRFAKHTGLTRRSLETPDAKVAEAIRLDWEHRLTFHREGIKRTPVVPIRFSDFIRQFLDHRTGQGRASETINAYRSALNNFGTTLGNDVLLSAITLDQIERHGSRRRDEGISPKTIRNELVVLLGAFRWAKKQRFVEESPAEGLELPKKVAYPPRYLRKEDFLALMRAIDDEAFRDVVRFYLLTGCRRCEGPDIRISRHIDLERRTITIPQRKSGDFKTLPISDDLLPVVRRLMLRSREDVLVPVHEDTLTTRFRAYAKKAGLPTAITFHALRHTAGTWLGSEGITERTIQTVLGHRDPESTRLYVHAYNEDLKGAVAKLKLPVERKGTISKHNVPDELMDSISKLKLPTN